MQIKLSLRKYEKSFYCISYRLEDWNIIESCIVVCLLKECNYNCCTKKKAIKTTGKNLKVLSLQALLFLKKLDV